MKYPTFFVHLSGFIIHGRKLTINVMNFVIDNNFLQNTLFVHLLFKIDIVYFAVVKFSVQEESYDISIISCYNIECGCVLSALKIYFSFITRLRTRFSFIGCGIFVVEISQHHLHICN